MEKTLLLYLIDNKSKVYNIINEMADSSVQVFLKKLNWTSKRTEDRKSWVML